MRLYKKVSELVEDWEPKKKYRSKEEYEQDLREFLSVSLNKQENAVTKETIEVKLKKENHDFDVVIDNQVGVEIIKAKKKTIPRDEADELFDEIIEKRQLHKQGVIVVLIGKVSPETKNDFKDRTYKIGSLTRIVSPLRQFRKTSYQVEFIDKSWD